MTDQVVVIEPYFNRNISTIPQATMPKSTVGFWGTSQQPLPRRTTESRSLGKQQAEECQGCKFSACSMSDEGCPLGELRPIRAGYDLMRANRDMEALKTCLLYTSDAADE